MRPRVRVYDPEPYKKGKPDWSEEIYVWQDTIYHRAKEAPLAVLYSDSGGVFTRPLFELKVEPKEKEYTYEDL